MKLLLTSVMGPYGVDDAYGRKENVMELFHNQVTREQGLFSLRFHHQSFGLHFLAENIAAPAVVLDFPSEARFVKELEKGYDYVGISFIVPNFIKAQHMAKLVREHAPKSKIILGGHGTRITDVEKLIEHDHICRGEGVRWLRQLLGEPVDAPFKHPVLASASFKKVMGVPLAIDAAVLIPGVGCPNGCRFCATTHFFDKQYTPYFDTGRELFDICEKVEKATGLTEFFVMDENFLKRPERAAELTQLMEKHGKTYRFGIFSSAETIAKVGVPFLARLGVYFVWIGVESKVEVYEKNRGIALKPMIKELRDHGISVLASGILFSEHHDKQTIHDDIRFLVDLESDFVQFMGLGPMPGTKLYDDYEAKGVIRHDLPMEEWHGQHEIWFRHPHFTGPETAQYLRDAFRYDFDTQGSSLLRMTDTALRGVVGLQRYDDPIMQRRQAQSRAQAQHLRPGLMTLRHYAQNPRVRELTEALIRRYDEVLGPVSFVQRASSWAVRLLAAREMGRIRAGRVGYQPKTQAGRYRMSLAEQTAAQLRAMQAATRASSLPILGSRDLACR